MHIVGRRYDFIVVARTIFRSKTLDILQSYGRILFVDAVEHAFVTNILFGNERNAFTWIIKSDTREEQRGLIVVRVKKLK